MRSVLFVLFVSFAGPAAAQSSLGISGAALSFGSTEDEAGARRSSVEASVDVAVTGVHGFQGDVALVDHAAGTAGSLAAHLYMAPTKDRKYGLFATMSDLDGRAMTWVSMGAEGMVQVGDNGSLELRAGLGAANAEGLDYIFGGMSYAHALTSNLDIAATLDLAEFDEPSLRAISYDAGLRATYQADAAPWAIYASATRSGLAGRDSRAGETRLGLGITVSFGATGGTKPSTRPFRSTDPLAPLLRRDLW